MKLKSFIPRFENKQSEKSAMPPPERHATLSGTKD
jgi:hypothetical protein